MLTIVSMLSVDTVWVTPAASGAAGGDDRNRVKAGAAKRRFASPDGDHLTLLNVYDTFTRVTDKRGTCSYLLFVCFWFADTNDNNMLIVISRIEWCFDNFVNFRSLTKAVQVRAQLTRIYERTELPVLTAGTFPSPQFPHMYTSMNLFLCVCMVILCCGVPLCAGTNTEPVRRCLVSGLFLNAARLQPDGRSYKPLAGTSGADTSNRSGGDVQSAVQIHPSSVLSGIYIEKYLCVCVRSEMVRFFHTVCVSVSRSVRVCLSVD
jgi:hypothetical protein